MVTRTLHKVRDEHIMSIQELEEGNTTSIPMEIKHT
jgi:hypothetical protein